MKSRSWVFGLAAVVMAGLAAWGVYAWRPAVWSPGSPTATTRAPSARPNDGGAARERPYEGSSLPAPALPSSPPSRSVQPGRAPEIASKNSGDAATNVFPWPPPAPSTSYQLTNSYFAAARTMGDVAHSITQALESSGYVERRYYKLPVDGLALVTRLERVNADGSPATPRWLTSNAGGANLYLLVRGLFVTDPGHYRVIVFFITKDLPGRKLEDVPIAQAKAWLKGGLDDVPADAGSLPYTDGRTIAYIYDFVSDGRTFVLDREPMPGKDQLTKAGVLTALAGGGK